MQVILFKILPTWSCVPPPRPIISNGWYLTYADLRPHWAHCWISFTDAHNDHTNHQITRCWISLHSCPHMTTLSTRCRISSHMLTYDHTKHTLLNFLFTHILTYDHTKHTLLNILYIDAHTYDHTKHTLLIFFQRCSHMTTLSTRCWITLHWCPHLATLSTRC